MAKKKKVIRREWTAADIKELKAHSKARTPVVKIAKMTKRTEGAPPKRETDNAQAHHSRCYRSVRRF
ncbi:hypothetical protein ACKWRH_34125 [Bradyrhizobium sp. Pa8]|uniref:hypothetical protein n=1 Tax=Bradyrhizobium sp. Pa8 TaxID=3386552 RepID=UPI00403F4C59